MSKHTPGPWKVGPDIIGPFTPERGFGRHIVAKMSDARLKRQKVSAEQVEADYALIAAAPELLEALEAMTVLAEGPTGGVTQQQKREVLAKARAAIAKARGEA